MNALHTRPSNGVGRSATLIEVAHGMQGERYPMVRFACAVVVCLTVTVQCLGQEGVPQLVAVPARVCDPAATDDQETGTESLAKEIEQLIADLPRGRERDIAEKLLSEVSDRRLPGFCLDPRSGDYVAASVSGTGAGSGEFRVALGNRSLPEIEVDVIAAPDEGTFDYAYRVSNEAMGAPITTWGLLTPVPDRTKTLTHPIWQVGAAAQKDQVVAVAVREGSQMGMGALLSPGGSELSRWRAAADRFAIQAGSSLSLFRVRSDFRPGWTTAYVGSADAIEIPQQPLSDDVKAGLEVLSRPEHYFTPVLTLGPKFEPGTDRTWIAGDWHLGLQILIPPSRLSAASPYVAELLDALLRIAASAPEARVPLKVGSTPSGAMEALVDKAVRMALQ